MTKMTLAAALVKAGLRMRDETVGAFGAEIKKLIPTDRQWFADRFAAEYAIEIVNAF